MPVNAQAWQDFYQDRAVIVLGGAGFLGSHLVERLVGLGARVTVVDALIPGSGGRLDNLAGVISRIHFVQANYGDISAWSSALEPGCIVFHCAAFNTHRWCNEHPEQDARWNYLPNCALAELFHRLSFSVRLLYASSRTVYPRSSARIVTERHPVAPSDVYSLHCWASEQLLTQLLGSYHAVLLLRLSHLYGPRQRLQGVEIGFMGELLRAALSGEPYELFAKGEVYRDVLYVGDAVEIFLRLGAHWVTGVFNVPGAYVSARTIAQMLESLCGWSSYRLVETPALSFPRLSGRKLREVLGQLLQTPLREALWTTLQALQRC
ncbi:MAG: NAD-dependent epimerase/dehydratase family protein [Candidatus Kapabacteria bacterium]|nr:NAD-dependent epimerase/dehydratase family protein [Candidatus Kapabacteria bacterium]MDW8011786.1 NAD-dependent epimerase/dehydratase family protein [Bacteroidota bacterium]